MPLSIMMGGWSILHQRSLPRPPSFRMISGTITCKVFLAFPHHLSLIFLLITPRPSSPLSIHHPCWNPIRLGMMTQPLTISVFLPCQCSHLLIFHIIIPCPSSHLSSHRQFWKLSIHQKVPPRMNPNLLPCSFSLLLFIHIIPHRFSLLRFVQSNLRLPSRPSFMPQKIRRVVHRRQIAILHRRILPPLLITRITTTGITSQIFDLSIHHQV